MSCPPLSISMVVLAYPPSIGGAQSHAHELAKALLGSGTRTNVSAFWNTTRSDWLLGSTVLAPPRSNWIREGIPVRVPSLGLIRRLAHLPILPFQYPFPSIATPILSRLLRPALEATIPLEVDLIHHIRIGREILAHASLAIARRRGIPFVLTPLHHPRWTGWRYREWIRIYREADLLFALTNEEKRILADLGVEPARIQVVGHAPSSRPQQTLQEKDEDRNPSILFLGQHYEYKGWRALLEAAPLVWSKHPKARFVFAGPDVGRSRNAFEGHDSRIERLGPVDEASKTRLLRECTLLALPSTQESFGGVFAEAWSFAKPVLGCPIPAVSELVQEGVNGLLRAQDPQELADAICWILDHPEESNAMGRAGQALVEDRFSWPAIASNVRQAYLEVSGRT